MLRTGLQTRRDYQISRVEQCQALKNSSSKVADRLQNAKVTFKRLTRSAEELALTIVSERDLQQLAENYVSTERASERERRAALN